MAVQIFRDGESIFIQPKALKAHLSIGWSVSDPGAPKVEPLEIQYPEHLKDVESLPPEIGEKAVLEAMGIEIVHPESTPPEKPRRGRKKKAKK